MKILKAKEQLNITITWEGSFKYGHVIGQFHRGGTSKNKYSGEDYGLYQIYGPHILYKQKVLLYVGQAADQTLSQRMFQHYKDWIYGEPDLDIYVGRVSGDISWKRCVNIAEAILVYKYTPNYNSSLKQVEPNLYGYQSVCLHHLNDKARLESLDCAPKDYQYQRVQLKNLRQFKQIVEGKKQR